MFLIERTLQHLACEVVTASNNFSNTRQIFFGYFALDKSLFGVVQIEFAECRIIRCYIL
jgi:hypothetical protein